MSSETSPVAVSAASRSMPDPSIVISAPEIVLSISTSPVCEFISTFPVPVIVSFMFAPPALTVMLLPVTAPFKSADKSPALIFTLPVAAISEALTPLPVTVTSAPEILSFKSAASLPAFMFTVPVASTTPALTPAPSTLIFPPFNAPCISTSAPSEFISIKSVPVMFEPEASVSPFVSIVTPVPDIFPVTAVCAPFV